MGSFVIEYSVASLNTRDAVRPIHTHNHEYCEQNRSYHHELRGGRARVVIGEV